jgi:hypothetical protein
MKMNRAEIKNFIDELLKRGYNITSAVIELGKILNEEPPLDILIYYQQKIGGE